MKVYLNGNEYALEAGTGVRRTPLLEWPDNIRLDGQQQRKDRSLLSSFVIDRWSDGLGIERQNVNVPAHDYRLWDAENCDTRNESFIVLSPELQTPAITPSRGDLDIIFQHLNNIYFAQGTGNVVHQFTAPDTLGSFSVLGSTFGSFPSQISGVKSFSNYIAVTSRKAFWGGGYHRVPAIGGVATFQTSLFSGEIRYPQLADYSGTLHILDYRNASNLYTFWVGNQELGSLTCVGSIYSPVGTQLSPLVTDGVTMFAHLPGAIYDFDITPSILIDTSRDIELNPVSQIYRQNLLFKNSKSLTKYDGTDLTPIGYDIDDGLKGEKFGEITAMTSSWKYNFAAVKGGTYSHILTWDSQSWQYYARIPTAGIWVREMLLSNSPDGIDRLWLVFGNHPNPGYFLNPIVNPLQAGTYAYVPTGQFTRPYYDGGMAELPGAMYDIGITADGMGGSNIITAMYGINGDEPVTTLGVVASTFDILTFGSPYGIEARRIQPQLILAGANSGTSPVFREATINFLKDPDIRETYEFTIDLRETARARANSLEQVIGSLNSERASKVMMPFWYGRIGTKAVKVLDMPSIEEVEADRDYQGERQGFVSVKCVEIL